MKKTYIIPLVLSLALLGFACDSRADDDDDDDHHHSTIGQSAKQGAGGIVNSVGQFLQGLGANMSQPAQKPVEGTPAAGPQPEKPLDDAFAQPPQNPADTPPATTEKTAVSEETNIAAGYENASKKKVDLFLSCPSCGQKFQVTGFPKGAKAYCPSCGKPIEEQE